MPNSVNDNDRQSAGVALWSPPHRRVTHYFRVKKEGRLETCDQLHTQMEIDNQRLKYLEAFTEPSSGFISQLFTMFYLPIFMNCDGALDDMRAEELETLRRNLQMSTQYDRDCLGKKVVVPENGMLRQAADMAVRGAQFVYEHPGYVAAAVGIGAILVFAPEVAPVILAF